MSFLPKAIPVTGFFGNAPLSGYPLAIFDVNNAFIGIADDASDVVTIWNAAASNSALGTLSATNDAYIFNFTSPSGAIVNKVMATTFKANSGNFTLIGSSYFSDFDQTVPYLYDKIKDFWQKGLTGYTTWDDNNGKVAHDRLRSCHVHIDGISYPNTTFFYWNVNDMLYQSNLVGQTNKPERTKLKVKNSQFTALANSFSQSFNYMADVAVFNNISTFHDSDSPGINNYWASKSYSAGKNIVVLNDHTSYVEFTSIGKTNIVHYISDGYSQIHGTFDIYVNGILYASVVCNSQTINLSGLNPSIPTDGDAPASPNSIILPLPDGQVNVIKIQSTSDNPVWLDYYSTIITDVKQGAKPVFACNCPKFNNGPVPIYGGGTWTADNALVQAINEALLDVFTYWHDILGAPAFLADVYTGWDPVAMTVPDLVHMNQLGTDHVMQALFAQQSTGLGGNFICL